ncbi:hypothetical protein [Mesorhizobium sp. M0203]|uniref:hypothetical protein n=1 Tax=Mesorhizobium sp. M0203 TaxID=2956912 RepID=UPI00333C4FC0
MSKMLEEAESLVSGMSEAEVRARTEALEMGWRSIVETVLAALLLQAPHPARIEKAVAARLDELKNDRWPDDIPDAFWAPQAIHAGAEQAADRILHSYRSSPARR